MKTLLAVVALMLAAAPSFAQPPAGWPGPKGPSLLDYAKRLSVMGVADYAFDYASEQATPTTPAGKEFTVGVQGIYLLSPMLTLQGGSTYHLDSKQIRSYVGIAVPFYGPERTQALPKTGP